VTGIGASAGVAFPVHCHMLRDGCGYAWPTPSAMIPGRSRTGSITAMIQHTVRYTELDRRDLRTSGGTEAPWQQPNAPAAARRAGRGIAANGAGRWRFKPLRDVWSAAPNSGEHLLSLFDWKLGEDATHPSDQSFRLGRKIGIVVAHRATLSRRELPKLIFLAST